MLRRACLARELYDLENALSPPLTYLVASPHMLGGMFERAVVLLLDHAEGGAMGLVVSLQTEMPLQDLLPQAKGQRARAYLGGPVEPQVGWCLYDRPAGFPGEVRLAERLLVTSSLEVLEAVMARGDWFMLLLGYAGWRAGQLEEETRGGSWVFLEAGPELILDTPCDARWNKAWELLGVDPRNVASGGAQA